MKNYIILFLFLILCTISCTTPSNHDTTNENSKKVSQDLENSKITNDSNEPIYESADKVNVEDGINYIKHTKYGIKMLKPTGWKKFPCQSEHTILKVANKKYGAQVSLNRLRDINNDFEESDLDYNLKIFLEEVSKNGLVLQNVIKQKTLYKGLTAIRLDATYMLYKGDSSLVEKIIIYQFINDNILYTLSTTFPEILTEEVGYSVFEILNSITFGS
jgi:hypothetical protein